MKKFTQFTSIIVLVFIVLFISGCGKQENDDRLKIITTNFVGYDFARSIAQENINISMLIKPGNETHSYDPSTKDIININEADIFIYIGGESEEWVNKILNSIDNQNLKIIRLMDYIELIEEDDSVGDYDHEHHHDHNHEEEIYDEHIWTSPINSIILVEAISKAIIEIDEKNMGKYEANTKEYIEKIKLIDVEIRKIVDDAKRKVLVFGDRFPFQYFVNEYELDYYAAFPGCSSDTEPSVKTVAYLIDKVKKESIPVILYLELSNKNIAETIASDTGSKVMLFHSAHNVTLDEFKSGKTYVDIMKDNIKVLKEVLN